MKRILSAFLILAAAFFLVACIDNKVELTDVSATTGENNGEIRVSAKIKDDEDGKINYIVVEKSGAAPTVDEVISGSNYGSVTVSAKGNAEKTLDKTVTGLTGGTEYSVYFVASNDDTKSGVVKKDVTAKEVTTTVEAPTVTATAVTSVAISGGIDITASTTAGTIYYVVTASSAVKPSAEEVVAGNEYAGNAVVAKGNGATIDTTVSGLDEGTTYAIYFAAKNDTVHSEVVKKEATAKVDTDERGVQATVDCSTNGEGTEESPFVVCSVEDMENIGDGEWTRNGETVNYSGSNFYIQGSDIDLGTKYNKENWDAGTADWTQTYLGGYDKAKDGVGGSASGFKGTFDGNGYEISGLYIDAETQTSKDGGVALIAYVGETKGAGTLKNITIKDFDISSAGSNGRVGGLVGRFRGEVMENIRAINVKATSTYGDSRVGAVVGRISNITSKDMIINNVQADKDCVVTGLKNVGGVFGHADQASSSEFGIKISNVVSYATVTASNETAGGIVGYSNAHLTNVVSYANVTAPKNAASVASQMKTSSKYVDSAGEKIVPLLTNAIVAGGTVKANVAQTSDQTSWYINGNQAVGTSDSGTIVSAYVLDSVKVTIIDGDENANEVSEDKVAGSDMTGKTGLAITADNLKDSSHAMYENFNFNSFWEMENNVPTLKDIFKSYVA